jgi:hypothetical protein
VTPLRTAFESRVAEAEKFFSLLTAPEATSWARAAIPDGALPMLKATAFLVLYNIAEASMRDGISAIYDALENARVSFDDLCPELKRVVASNLRQHSDENISDFAELAKDAVYKTFDAGRIFSGNVDAKEIRRTAKAYGFRKPSADGSDLLVIKRARNDLAHGNKTFIEVGREHTVEEILRMKSNAIEYLRCAALQIEAYIQEREYLQQTLRPEPRPQPSQT